MLHIELTLHNVLYRGVAQA